jgi:hypothetical protein|tara:strand:+ start:627 stop:1175 length:549 start_codon:yes stop_codon:yes gene_type:complete
MISFVDNFLPIKELHKLQNLIHTTDLRPVTNMENKQLNIGFRNWISYKDPIFKVFNKRTAYHFPLSKKFVPQDDMISLHLRHNKEKPIPHTDGQHIGGIHQPAPYNILFYLKGEKLLNNGTGFYVNGELSAHVGFVENRALFFKGGDIYHTNLQYFGDSSPRYTLITFFAKKDFEGRKKKLK